MSRKNKTNKAIAGRFKVSKTGKVLHKGVGRNHNTNKQPRDRWREKAIDGEIKGKVSRTIKRELGQ